MQIAARRCCRWLGVNIVSSSQLPTDMKRCVRNSIPGLLASHDFDFVTFRIVQDKACQRAVGVLVRRQLDV